jgi:hypothetical protein
LPNEERYSINIKELVQALEFDSKNEDSFKEALWALMVCKVGWNMLNKDNQWEWGVTTLLAEASVKSGVCTYATDGPCESGSMSHRCMHGSASRGKTNLKASTPRLYGNCVWITGVRAGSNRFDGKVLEYF